VSRDGILGENTELIDEAFVVDWKRTEIVTVDKEAVSTGESDNE
jgi:hypothetical protein